MDVLSILPNIEYNLKKSIDLAATLNTIAGNIEILAPHIDIRLLHDIHEKIAANGDTTSISILLSKIYFIRDDYRNSIAYFNGKHKENSFYYHFIHIKLVDTYLNNRDTLSAELIAYVEDILEEEKNMGIIMETKRYDMIKHVKDGNTLEFLKGMMEIEEFHRLVLHLDLRGEYRYFIDALIYTELLKCTEKGDTAEKDEEQAKDLVKHKENTPIENEAERHGVRFISYNDVESAKFSCRGAVHAVEKYIASLSVKEQFGASYYVSEAFPQVAAHVRNALTAEILNGNFKRMLVKDFLQKNNKTNFSIFSSIAKGIKKNIKSLNLPLIFTNTFLNLCTGNDTFYRRNENFFRGLKGWNKYIGIECFGLIHIFSNDDTDNSSEVEAHPEEAAYKNTEEEESKSSGSRERLKLIEILQDLLPSTIKSGEITFDNVNSTESAALHALGLAGKETDFIFNFLDTENFFGSTLGMGNAYFATHNAMLTVKFLENLKREELHFECFAYAIGQINAKSMDMKLLTELENIIRFSEHNRIAYSSAVAMALIALNDRSYPMYNAEELRSYNFHSAENATTRDIKEHIDGIRANSKHMLSKEYRNNDALENLVGYILCLTKNQNAYLRLAGTLCLGTFFVKTGNVAVIDSLLNMVKDNSEDVRRAAILSLGMVVRDENLVSILNFKVLSHCPFVRSAVALTIGLFLCASGNSEAVDLLETLLYDSNPLVVQNACIGLGLLLMQCNSCVSNFKRIVNKVDLIILRSGDNSAKFGALIFRGLINLGGTNLILSYKNSENRINYYNICNYILFYGFNYFYMLIIYLGLCYQPTAFFKVNVNGANKDVKEYKNIKYKLVGKILVEASKKLGAVEDVSLPKRKVKKFRRRGNEQVEPCTCGDKEEDKESGKKKETYYVKSGGRLTLREMMKTRKKDFSIEFTDDEE
ncbi:hypothetical protein VCUG_00558 [Vavraia culicis subsp. floridensis]|uniref:Uncharacterized protein n=1 Tax=Vavraia culicis (isolate floridensis) TaxID=948595 RepID=L2GY12_VAVCU|nr:uncharacterized protein VCUG_00558 [Vavraia culicis subsp. floridensis]ELA47975.1 hypothetical protein VCUG_00558 [Vavraia culicis subsp. floridensis]